MGLADNKKVACTFLENAASRNVDALLDALADDLHWWVLGHGTLSRALFEEEQRAINDIWAGPMTLKITGITAEGNRVAVEAEIENDFRDGRHYHQHSHFLFVVHDGKIREFKIYHDTKHAAESFGNQLPEGFRKQPAS